MTARDPKLHLRGVRKSFGARTVVSIDDLAIGRHGIEGLIGPNGAGKTTLMGLITRKLTADSGAITYWRDGEPIDVMRMGMDAVVRAGLVKTNQVIQDFDSLSIRDSLRLSLTPPRYESMWGVLRGRALPDAVEREVDDYLRLFRFQKPDGHALSAGEKKLLDILRCLVLKPRVLLMDEPTAGLPDDLTRQVMELVVRKVREEGLSVLIVEHDLDLIWSYCEYVHFVADGRLQCQGMPQEVKESRLVAEKYMGIVDA